MNYLGISKCSIADGSGVRVVLWVSGCNVHCQGCQNPDSWDFNAGNVFDEAAKERLFEALNHSWVKGLTLSGGHPLEYNNLPYIYDLIKEIKEKFPDKDIWLYTGYTLRDSDFDTTIDVGWDSGLLSNYILAMCDVVIDGPYVESLRDISLKFRGSSNQRLIDVKKTLEQHKINLMED
mgnify:FL=1